MDYGLWSILLVFLFGHSVHGVRYIHHPSTQKCFRDEVQAHQLTVIEFEVSDAPGQRIDYEVSLISFLIRFIINKTGIEFCENWLRVLTFVQMKSM